MLLEEAPHSRFTIDEFKSLPLEGRRWELVDGVVQKMEIHGARESSVTGSLLYLLGSHVREKKDGIVLGPGCGFQLWPDQETVRVTDVSFTSSERLDPERFRDDFPRTAPDLMVEIFSPFEHFMTVMKRILMFLEAGTEEAWLVDQQGKSVTIFRGDRLPEILHEHDLVGKSGIIPGFQMLVSAVIAED
jgi:Uma2 family endonuclease